MMNPRILLSRPLRAVRSPYTCIAATRALRQSTHQTTLHITSNPAARRPISTSRSLWQGPNVQEVTGTQSDQATGVAPPEYLSKGELHVFNKLKEELEPTKLEVQDISGGCGSMYGLDIVSSKFKGLSVIKQHQLVNKVLKEEIGSWHGVQLKTKAA